MAAAIATLDVCEGDSRLSSDNATMPRKSAVEQLHFFFVFHFYISINVRMTENEFLIK